MAFLTTILDALGLVTAAAALALRFGVDFAPWS